MMIRLSCFRSLRKTGCIRFSYNHICRKTKNNPSDFLKDLTRREELKGDLQEGFVERRPISLWHLRMKCPYIS